MLDMFFFGMFFGLCIGMGVGICYMSWWSRIPLKSMRPASNEQMKQFAMAWQSIGLAEVFVGAFAKTLLGEDVHKRALAIYATMFNVPVIPRSIIKSN